MVASASEFRKNSFNDQDSATLARVAALYQNVADGAISASDSASFIISQMKAFGIEAENSIDIINAVNAVSNNFAVSSTDISSALTKTSSAMSTLGNDFQSTIGLVTAGTEIMTGQAGKVARGLRTIGNNFASAAQEADSIEYSVGGVTKSLSLLNEKTGDIKSTFDIFSGLKDDWDKMSNAEQQALAIAYAGQTQFEVFAAVMNNFKTATDATTTAFNSAGSAMQENSKYMDSVEAKENQLKAEFEDFANRVLSKDVVTGFLNAGTVMLNFANNDVGAAITRMGAFAAVVGSAVGIIGSIIGKLMELSKALKSMEAVKGAGFLSTLVAPKTLLIIAAVAGAIAGLIELGRYVNEKAYEAAHAFEIANEKLSETTTQIDETSQSLSTYKQRLEELNAIPLEERGAAWSNERAELDLNIQSAEAYLELLNTIAQSQAQELYSQDRVSGYSVKTSNIVGPQGRYTIQYRFSDEQKAAMEKQYNSEYEALVAVTSALADATNGQEAFISAEEMATLVGKSQEEQIKLMTKMLANLHLVMDTTTETTEDAFANMATLGDTEGKLTQTQKELAQTYLDLYKNAIRFNLTTDDQADAYVKLLAKVSNFDIEAASNAEVVAFLANSLNLSAQEATNLALTLGLLENGSVRTAEGVVKLANGTYVAKSACKQLADGTWELKENLDETDDSAEDLADSLNAYQKSVKQVTDDEKTFVNSLFDANGNLTAAAQQALAADSAMADYAKKILEAQQAQATANYSNLILELEKVGNTAILSGQQISQMMSLVGISSYGTDASMRANLERTYRELTGKSPQKDKVAYSSWVKKYLQFVGEQNYQRQLEKLQEQITSVGTYTTSTGGGGSSSSTTTTKSPAQIAAEAATKAAKYKLEAMQDELDALNDEKSALEDEIQRIQDEVKAEYQAEIDILNDKKEAIQDAYDAWKEDADAVLDRLKAEKDAIQAVIDAIDKEKEQLEAATAYATEYASRQIDEIDERLDELDAREAEINKKYDDELDKLKATNKELDKQIEREKLLQNLASAKNKKKRVYSAQQGYILVDDIAAISKAQAELDKFDRQQKESLEEQEIENERKQELLASGIEAEREALEEQKKLWEDYSKKWSSIVSDYEFKQNRLAYIQRTGKAIEQQNWQQRNKSVEQATKDYADIMARLLAEQERMAAKEAEIAAQEAAMEEARIENQKATAAIEQQISDLQDEMVAAQEARTRKQMRMLNDLADAIEDAQRRVNEAQREYDDASDYEDSVTEEGRVLGQINGKAPSYAKKGDYIATAGGIWKITDGKYPDFESSIVPGTRGKDFRDVGKATQWLIENGVISGYAAGTRSATPGLHLLGEEGPELGVLSRGDGVIPADITKNLMNIGKNPEKFASAAVAKTGGDIIMQGVTLAFPNVRDGSDASAFTKNFVNLAHQYAYRR